MTVVCSSRAAEQRGGEHRLDPVEFKTYETVYVCLDCGEECTQFQSGQGG